MQKKKQDFRSFAGEIDNTNDVGFYFGYLANIALLIDDKIAGNSQIEDLSKMHGRKLNKILDDNKNKIDYLKLQQDNKK